MKRLRGKVTYANVMVTVLAFLVLGGGTAFAATQMLAKDSVGSKQIRKEAVTPAKLSSAAKGTLTAGSSPQGAKGETGAIGPIGIQGIPGPPGIQGERGEPGIRAWAHVGASGELIEEVGIAHVHAPSAPPDIYCVFPETGLGIDLEKAAIIVTPSALPGGHIFGWANNGGCSEGDTPGFEVSISNLGGDLVTGAFSVAVLESE